MFKDPVDPARIGAIVKPGACDGIGATQVQLGDLASRVGYPVLMPDAPEANTQAVVHVFVCLNGEPIIEFDSGVVLASEPGSPPDSDENLRQFVGSDPNEASLATVLGRTAAVIDPAADGSGQALGSVTFDYDRVRYWLLGNRKLGAEDLVRNANTLAPLK